MARRRAVHDCPSDCSRSARAAYVRAAEGFDSPPPVQNSDSGGYWRQGDCAQNHCSAPQGCNREMLWRYPQPPAEAAGKPEGGQEEDEGIGYRIKPSGTTEERRGGKK